VLVTSWEKQELVLALSMRICVIETGDPVLRATDVHNQLRGADGETRARLTRMLKPLGTETMRLIVRLEELKDKILKAKVTDA
jgi:hypothetical protein